MWRTNTAVAMAVAAALATSRPSVRAAAECDGAAITWPVAGQAVAGRTAIYGSAAVDAFQFYKLEYAAAGAPEAWRATSDVVRTAARHTRLDRWSTDGVPDGTYRLKLTVVDTAAHERCRRIVESVVVANGRAAAAAATVAAAARLGSPEAPPVAALAHVPAAPWPTAVAQRAVVQSTAPITAEADAAPTVVKREVTSTVTGAGTVSAGEAVTGDVAAGGPATGDATAGESKAGDGPASKSAPSAPAALVARFGKPFAIAFALVAALMTMFGLRALRAANRRGDGPQR